MQLTLSDVRADLAADIRVFIAKEQVDPEAARASHARVIRFLKELAPQIDCAAGYAMVQAGVASRQRIAESIAAHHGDIDGDMEGAL